MTSSDACMTSQCEAKVSMHHVCLKLITCNSKSYIAKVLFLSPISKNSHTLLYTSCLNQNVSCMYISRLKDLLLHFVLKFKYDMIVWIFFHSELTCVMLLWISISIPKQTSKHLILKSTKQTLHVYHVKKKYY